MNRPPRKAARRSPDTHLPFTLEPGRGRFPQRLSGPTKSQDLQPADTLLGGHPITPITWSPAKASPQPHNHHPCPGPRTPHSGPSLGGDGRAEKPLKPSALTDPPFISNLVRVTFSFRLSYFHQQCLNAVVFALPFKELALGSVARFYNFRGIFLSADQRTKPLKTSAL